jgi:solute carrier family 6 (neurotransmitter transporter, amino acid/orphan) member 15/16/17/18/20
MSSPSVNEPENFNYSVAIALIVAWSIIYVCMVQGITSSGKIVYITALFPYVVLIIFFFRGVTLHGKGNADRFCGIAVSNTLLQILGASAGIKHLFTPRWESILEPVVWLEAGTQIFFSLGLAFGGLIAFSSYNPANNNCYRDALVSILLFSRFGTN